MQRNTDINSSIKYHIFDIFATGEFLQESFQVNKVENYLKKIGYKIFVQQCFFQNIVRQTLFSPQIFCHQTFPYNAGQSQIIILKGPQENFPYVIKGRPVIPKTMENILNTSLAAKGALAHRLQCRTACKIQNGCQGAPKWPTGSGKVYTPRFLGILSNF